MGKLNWYELECKLVFGCCCCVHNQCRDL